MITRHVLIVACLACIARGQVEKRYLRHAPPAKESNNEIRNLKGSKGGSRKSKGSSRKSKGKGGSRRSHYGKGANVGSSSNQQRGGYSYYGKGGAGYHSNYPQGNDDVSKSKGMTPYQKPSNVFHRHFSQWFGRSGPSPTAAVTATTSPPTLATTATPPPPPPTQAPIPQDEERLSSAPTSSPTCQQKPLDVCIAIDRSGSICTPAGQPFISCKANPKNCGCDNFDSVRQFTTELIEGTSFDSKWAIIAYATTARVETPLVRRDEAVNVAQEFHYTGGWTSTGPALELCRNELNDSKGERRIILLTDGTPTRPDPNSSGAPYNKARDYATEQANSAKEDDIQVITVFVNTATGTSSYLESLASPGSYVQVSDFAALNEVSEKLLENLSCL